MHCFTCPCQPAFKMPRKFLHPPFCKMDICLTVKYVCICLILVTKTQLKAAEHLWIWATGQWNPTQEVWTSTVPIWTRADTMRTALSLMNTVETALNLLAIKLMCNCRFFIVFFHSYLRLYIAQHQCWFTSSYIIGLMQASPSDLVTFGHYHLTLCPVNTPPCSWELSEFHLKLRELYNSNLLFNFLMISAVFVYYFWFGPLFKRLIWGCSQMNDVD